MAWMKPGGNGIEYVGRLAPPRSFDRWAEAEGRQLVDALAQEKGFTLLGRERAAKRELWDELERVAQGDALAAAIQAEADDYPRLLARIAEKAEGLPESDGEPPVVAIPRFILHRVALDIVTGRLGQSAQLNRLRGGSLLNGYFCRQLVGEMDEALIHVRVSPRKPLLSDGDWLIVGTDADFHWLPGRPPGHYYLHRAPGGRIGRSDRKEVEQKLTGLAVSLGRMSSTEKDELVQGIKL